MYILNRFKYIYRYLPIATLIYIYTPIFTDLYPSPSGNYKIHIGFTYRIRRGSRPRACHASRSQLDRKTPMFLVQRAATQAAAAGWIWPVIMWVYSVTMKMENKFKPSNMIKQFVFLVQTSGTSPASELMSRGERLLADWKRSWPYEISRAQLLYPYFLDKAATLPTPAKNSSTW